MGVYGCICTCVHVHVFFGQSVFVSARACIFARTRVFVNDRLCLKRKKYSQSLVQTEIKSRRKK